MLDPQTAAVHLRQRAAALFFLARRMEQLEVLTLHRSASADTWVGPSQAHCETSLRGHRSALLRHAAELAATARRMERVADQLASVQPGAIR